MKISNEKYLIYENMYLNECRKFTRIAGVVAIGNSKREFREN